MRQTVLPEPEIRRLLGLFCDGSLSEGEGSHLEALLLGNESVRRMYCDLLGLHAALAISLHEDKDDDVLENALVSKLSPMEFSTQPLTEELPGEAPRAQMIASSLPAIGAVRRWTQPLLRPVLYVSMATVVVYYGIMFGILWFGQPVANDRHDENQFTMEAQDDSIAMLTAGVNETWKHPAQAHVVGDRLFNGPLELADGFVELSLTNGVRLIVEGPAKINLAKASEVALDLGRLTASVPPKAVGFSVVTSQAIIVDLGTEFGVEVSPLGATHVEVFRGAIEMQTFPIERQKSLPSKQQLTAGQRASADPSQGNRIESSSAPSKKFARVLPKSEELSVESRSAYAEHVIGETNPVLYWSFDNLRESQLAKDLVRVHGPKSFIPAEAGVFGPRLANGFASMATTNRAIRMDNGGITYNSLATKFGIGVKEYSAQVWIKSSVAFDTQKHQYILGRGNGWKTDVDVRDSLLIGGNYAATPHVGCLGFFNGDNQSKQIVVGKTRLLPDRWYCVVLVRDGQKVRGYLDGHLEFSAESPWFGGDGDYLTLGHRVDLYSQIGLRGMLDEAAVWDRALRDEEIKAMYLSASQSPIRVQSAKP